MSKETNITFELEEGSNTSILVKRDGKSIGRVWSQHSDGGTPYPHDETEYCLNSVQICGFDRMSEIWGCGPFKGKKDCVIHFVDNDNEYHQGKEKKYRNYIENFINLNKPMSEMQSYDDWTRHSI